MKLAKGEIWKTDGRKGPLTLKLMQDVDTDEDGFFNAQILEGTARFISEAYQDAQRNIGLGMVGSSLLFRTTLTTFVERVGVVHELE
jgi:hypothetical protein